VCARTRGQGGQGYRAEQTRTPSRPLARHFEEQKWGRGKAPPPKSFCILGEAGWGFRDSALTPAPWPSPLRGIIPTPAHAALPQAVRPAGSKSLLTAPPGTARHPVLAVLGQGGRCAVWAGVRGSLFLNLSGS